MNESIPFLDLKAQYQAIRSEINEAVGGVLASSTYALGPEVAKFEEEFARYQSATHAVGVNSGVSALHLALIAAGVKAGDEVITVSLTFFATAAAISYTGATPVFVDVDPTTLTMDPAQIEQRITPRTRVILPVHLYGQAAEMDPIMKIAERHGLVVLEDAAQAHGAEYRGRRVGSIGHLGAFSFYPGKNLGAYGESGLVTTNNPEYARQIRLLRDWGQEKKYQHDMMAFNYRMDAIQGAVLRVKLRHLERWTELRRAHARRYDLKLAQTGICRSIEVPDRRHVYHIYSVFHPERLQLQAALSPEGIHSGMHYPIPVHLQKPYRNLGYEVGSLPVTERAARQQLSLPMFAELSEAQIDRVSGAVGTWLAGNAPTTPTAG